MKRIVLLIVGILGVFGVVLLFSEEEKEQVYLTNKEIKESNYIAVMVEQEDGKYQEEDAIPQSGYVLNEEKSKCNNGTIPTWESNKLKLSNLTSYNTSCYLYFEIASRKTLNALGLEVEEGTPDFSKTSCDTGTNNGLDCESTDKGLYKTEDDDGETYYFRGSVNNNWVSFAGYYWRIIRINGDGTIRLIYSGKVGDENSLTFPSGNKTNPTYVTGTGTQINTISFNISENQNRYVGYMYGNSSFTYDTDHANQISSNIKSKLESWYTANLENVNVGEKIAKDYIDTDAGFCGDRTPYNGENSFANVDYSKGGSTTITYYGGYFRLIAQKTPDLHCKRKTERGSTTLPETNDLYTVGTSKKGNQVLGSPVGLISADEVTFAGGRAGANNQGYYLYTNIEYWTMSPYYLNNSNAWVFDVYSNGYLGGSHVTGAYGVRPVINLKANTKFITNSEDNKGTFSNLYIVEGAN